MIRDTLAFAEDLLLLIVDGTKIITIRQGQRNYAELLTVTDL
jgi:hypothetical protein